MALKVPSGTLRRHKRAGRSPRAHQPTCDVCETLQVNTAESREQ